MTKKINELSVFFPAYNEEANLRRTIEKAVKFLPRVAKIWEILIINDGSADKTEEVAQQLGSKDKRIRVINHQSNKGYGEALKSGFYNARYDTIVYNDGDGQFDFSEVSKFLNKLGEADLIIGVRQKRADHPVRTLFAKGWAFSLFLFFKLKLRDVDCGFKMIKKKVLDTISHLESTRGGMINAELAIKTKKYGFNVVEVPVNHYPRLSGRPTGASIRVIIKSYVDLLKLWWKFLDRREFLVLVGILTVAAFLRFYRLPEYMTFLGDEGRDAILVRRLLVNFDPILIGPGTSIGNMYLGPLYYYMMAPAMFLFGLSPVGPAAQIAALGVLTVWLVGKIGQEWFGKTAGLIAAALYAVSPVIIVHAHSSWNPNIMPFFALLSIYSIWRVWRYHEWKWLLVLGVSYAFVLQSHYLGLLLAPALGLFWGLSMKSVWDNYKMKLYALRFTLYALAVFALLMSPLVIFDARHGWRNFAAMKIFFTQRQETVSLRPWNALPDVWPIWQDKFVTRFMVGMNEWAGVLMAAILLIGLGWIIWHLRRKIFTSPVFLLSVWFGMGLIGLGIYKQEIYDHYFGFMFAAPFLLLGAIAQQVSGVRFQVSRILLFGLVAVIIFLNLWVTPIKYAPNRQLQKTEVVAQKIADESKDKPFNMAVIAERNYEDAYQYFLEWWKKPVLDIDSLRYKETVTNQLFVVCELVPEKCDPTHNARPEVANFGWSKIDDEWDIAGVRLYKLVHSQPQQ